MRRTFPVTLLKVDDRGITAKFPKPAPGVSILLRCKEPWAVLHFLLNVFKGRLLSNRQPPRPKSGSLFPFASFRTTEFPLTALMSYVNCKIEIALRLATHFPQ